MGVLDLRPFVAAEMLAYSAPIDLQCESCSFLMEPQSSSSSSSTSGRGRKVTPAVRRFMLTSFQPEQRQDLSSKIKSLGGIVIEDVVSNNKASTPLCWALGRAKQSYLSLPTVRTEVSFINYIKSDRHGIDDWLSNEK